jgi:pimeloyl-ACP methyl ester carboxylesterase
MAMLKHQVEQAGSESENIKNIKNIKTSAGPLSVEMLGETGPVLVFWHVLYGDSRMWQAQIADLSGDYRLLLIDAPSHGRSYDNTAPFTVEACAQAIIEVLTAFGVEQALGVGLGWGGFALLQAALLAPRHFLALAVFDSAIAPHGFFGRLKMSLMARFISRYGFTKTAQKLILKTLLAPATFVEQPAVVDNFSEQLQAVNPKGLYNAVSSLLHRRPLAGLEQITLPTLVLVGEHDKVYPPHYSQQIAQQIKGARLVELAKAGHLGPLEVPTQVNKALREFFATL